MSSNLLRMEEIPPNWIEQGKLPRPRWRAPGMRQLRLLVWSLYRQTPLNQPINRNAERRAATKCKLTWEKYLMLRAKHSDLWQRWALKREKAKTHGWPPQPEQLRRYRKIKAPQERKAEKRMFATAPRTRGLPRWMKEFVWVSYQWEQLTLKGKSPSFAELNQWKAFRMARNYSSKPKSKVTAAPGEVAGKRVT
jgi:hypothetical protein